MKSHLFVAVLFLLDFFSDAIEWEPIPDKNDPHLIEIAKFAVDEHNKEADTALIFKTIFSGKRRMGIPEKYQLVLVAFDNSDEKGIPERISKKEDDPDRIAKYETRVHESHGGVKELKWFINYSENGTLDRIKKMKWFARWSEDEDSGLDN